MRRDAWIDNENLSFKWHETQITKCKIPQPRADISVHLATMKAIWPQDL